MLTFLDQDRQTEIFGKEQRDIGRAEGEARGVLKTAISMFKKGWISEAKAAEEAKMSISDFRKAMALLQIPTSDYQEYHSMLKDFNVI